MDSVPTQIDGSPFGRLPSLTHQIRELIRDYPEGIGIIKEVLQNADDAGARVLRIVADHRQHASRALPHPAMAALQGPAILLYNNEPFTDADFEGIQEIYQSGKVRAADKTGQFGKGFNTVYNVTDWPGFVTGERVAFFDPHCTTIPGATLDRPGRSWVLADCWRRYPDLLRPFTAAGLPDGAGHFEGTIFRLPFRTAGQAKRSEISNKPFTAVNLAELIRELCSAREELLLFLKRVEGVELSEVTATGSVRSVVTIATENPDEVRPARDRLVARLTGDTVQVVKRLAGLPPTWESYVHRFVTRRWPDPESESAAEEGRSAWRVIAGLAVDTGGAVAGAVEEFADRGMKVVPLAGAAARIEVDGDAPATRLIGRVYCGLPLPAESGFPVHLNGYFDLDTSRHALTAGNVTGNSRIRGRWNELLVANALAPAYARLIQDVAGDIGEEDPEQYYALWPQPTGTPPKPLDALPGHAFRALVALPVVRASSGPRWVPVGTVWVPPADREDLVAPLVTAGWVLPAPSLPARLTDALAAGGGKLNRMTPAVLRGWLLKFARGIQPVSAAPHACLRKLEWVEAFLRFCLSDGHADLTGLPLALTPDGRLRPFGPGPGAEPLYLAGDEEQRIFETRKAWFLDADFARRCGVTAGRIRGVTAMTPAEVAVRLPSLFAQPDNTRLVSAPGFPSVGWLRGVYQYFTRAAAAGSPPNVEDLRKVPLVPDQGGALRKPGTAATPLLIRARDGESLHPALAAFRVPLVTADPPLRDAITGFADACPNLIWPLSGPDLVDTLDAVKAGGLPPYSAATHHPLITFLADARWRAGAQAYSDGQLEKLRALPIFPTLNGTPRPLETDAFIAGEFALPDVPIPVPLLNPGADGRWRPFYLWLDVPVMQRADFITEFLLPGYPALGEKDQRDALRWLRAHLSSAEGELEEGAGSAADLRARVREARLVRCTDGHLHAPGDLYDPSSELVRDLFGETAPFPDVRFYGGSEQWLGFFRNLGMSDKPRASDLLGHVDRLAADAGGGVTQRLAQRILAVLAHLDERWEELRGQVVDDPDPTPLRDALRDRAWLPAERSRPALRRWPGAVAPEDRLYRPGELYTPYHANLVASQAPVLPARHVGPAVRRDLGFPPEPPLETVVAHFGCLIDLWAGDARPPEGPFEGAVNDVYRYLARFEGRPEAPAIRTRFAGRRCLWHDGDLWESARTFRAKVPFFGRRRVQVQVRPPLRQAYVVLGLRERPDLGDYLAHLSEVEAEAGGAALPAPEADRLLRLYPHLTALLGPGDGEARFPLLDGANRLVTADESVYPDAPWYADRVIPGTVHLLHPDLPPAVRALPWVRSLARDVRERPTGTWEPTRDARAAARAAALQATLRSEPFRRGLARLAWNQHGRYRASDFRWLASASVVPTDSFESELVLDVRGRDVVIGRGASNEYFDGRDTTFYVTAGSPVLMRQHLARSLNGTLDQPLGDLSALAAILECDPQEIDATLTELRVRVADEASDDGPPDDLEVPPDEGETDHAELGPDGGAAAAAGPGEPETPESETGWPAVDGPADTGGGSGQPGGQQRLRGEDATRRGHPRPAPTGPSGHTNGDGTRQPRPGTGGPSAPAGTGPVPKNLPRQSDAGRPPGPPAPPTPDTVGLPDEAPSPGPLPQMNSPGRSDGHPRSGPAGRSREGAAGTADRPPGGPPSSEVRLRPERRDRRRQRQRRDRVVTYVSAALLPDGTVAPARPLSDAERQRNITLGSAAVDAVCAFEAARGRRPTRLGQTHPGHDVDSVEPRVDSEDPVAGGVRRIEVKGISGPWTDAGVGLTPRQFQAAREYGDDFWLYVVEHADDPATAVVHPIRNPFSRITAYFFDRGWRQLTDPAEAPSQEGRVAAGDRLTVAGRGSGTVTDVRMRGAIRVVTVQLDDGQTLTRPFNPRTMTVL